MISILYESCRIMLASYEKQKSRNDPRNLLFIQVIVKKMGITSQDLLMHIE